MRRGGLSLPWLTAANAPMPAARISSGPSTSKRGTHAARDLLRPIGEVGRRQLIGRGVDQVAAAVGPCSRDARVLGRARRRRPRPAPQSTRRSISPRRSSSVFHRPLSYGPSSVPSTIARPCSSAESPSSSTTQATEVPPTSRTRAATLAAAVRSRSASSVRLPSPTAPTRAAPRRPSEWRRTTWPSSPRELSSRRPGRSAGPRPADRVPLRRLRAPRDRERQRRGRRPRPLPAAPRRRQSA